MSGITTIGIIGGHGWMGRALGTALLNSKQITPENLLVSSRSGGNAYDAWPGVQDLRDNQALVDRADLIVLSVRPDQLGSLTLSVSDKPVISLLAMAPCKAIANRTGSQRIIRAMPNAAADIGEAYMPWYATPEATRADRECAQQLLGSCGKARELNTEPELDYMTALTGAGPAYPALLASAMLAHAKANGIADDLAFEAVMQTLSGGCQLLSHLNTNPTDMVNRLIDYQGTTAKGLQRMMDEGFNATVMAGLTAAHAAATDR
ncbi:pyrroline-5-carboxylate reductase family protein [Saccharospirillum impatiens]|uniref:pyrroline-5-carboxylate reductase family protein n=1 Tax=Saccharospirillum impatiens TaxID=169438 RepID=UPI000424B547|nr:pyrroline-5-carboxylate reductase dimerization domain-containing protein [Saccharospirillum impatiens]